jgi:uncharacterized protein (DUF58 family)
MAGHLIQNELLRNLEQLELLARRRVRSSVKGERRSKARGQSVEFADHRNYVAGDDLRYLDWNLFGRLDRLFLKLYEEERELPLSMFLDASESMTFGKPEKFDFARQVAAAMGYVALCGFDRVSVEIFPDDKTELSIRRALREVRGKKSALQFFHQLSQLKAHGRSHLNTALKTGAQRARRGGIAIVISDFLDPDGYEGGLKALLAQGYQIHVLMILSRDELEPGTYGDLKMVDSENGSIQEVTFGKYRLKAYQETLEAYLKQLKGFCRQHGIGFNLTPSDMDLNQLLLRDLRENMLWG